MSKPCSKCGYEKRDEAFAASSASPDGLQAWCRDCKSRLPATPLQRVPSVSEKLCTKCGVTKHPLDFSLKVADDTSFGLQAWCKVCVSTYRKNRREAANPGMLRFERHQREQIKQDRFEALKKFDKQPPQ